MLIMQEGYYFGIITDNGFGTSSGGFPQEVLSVQAQQIFDTEAEEYVPIDPGGGTDMTWYGVLIGGNEKETLNCKQLKKVTGWDGADLVALSKADYSDMPIQFRVETRVWNEEPRLQITWIDEEGATPFKSVPKCTLEEAQALQARYAGVLAGNKAPVTAASAPGTANAVTPEPCANLQLPAAPPQEKPKRTRRTKKQIEADKAIEDMLVTDPDNGLPPAGPLGEVDTSELEAASPATTTTTAPATRPTMPATRPSQAQDAVGKCTMDEAWKAVDAARRDDVTDPQLAEAWFASIKQRVPGGEEKFATDEMWFHVRRDVLAATGKV